MSADRHAEERAFPLTHLQLAMLTFSFQVQESCLEYISSLDLSLEKQVSSIVKACFFHLRALSKVLSLLTREAAAAAACLILSELDYCNNLLGGLPQMQIKRLQAV